MNWFKSVLGLKPSADEFVEIAQKALNDLGHSEKLEYDSDQFAIKALEPDGSIKMVWYLGNAFETYCSAPRGERRDVLKVFFAQAQSYEIPETLDEALPNLMPRLQTRAFFEETALGMELNKLKSDQEGMPGFSYDVLANHYAVCLVYETENHISYIAEDKLKDWGTELARVLPRAIENLDEICSDPFQEIAPGLFMSQSQDNHDASRILLLDRIKELNVKGRPVAMMPNRDVLLITGESDHDAQEGMLNIVEKVLEQPRPMLPFPLVLSEVDWHNYVPNEHNKCRDRFEYWNCMGLADVYNTQKDLLDQIHELNGCDIFIGSYMLFQKEETGDLRSLSTWSEGVRAYLPRAEEIAFAKQDSIISTVPWEVAQQIVGDLMIPVDMYPERIEVKNFPSDKQLEELKEHSILK